MYISLQWLKEFVDIPSNITPEKLGDILTLHTVEVEETKKLGENLNKIVVGKIVELKKHPNADKLKLAIVDDGQAQKQVVCGGGNLREGMLVAFAQVGARVRWHGEGDMVKLEPAKIRGESSQGMICASSEIGLEGLFPAKNEREIISLPDGFKVGMPLAEALGLDDVVYDIDNKSMTHRPDLWGHYGLARELAALMDTNLKPITTNEIKTDSDNIKIKVGVKDQKLCPRYMAVAIDSIEIKPSKEKIQKRLIACGMRPINNIVDITNYIMLELGQPTHAFGASRIATNSKTNCREIIVRKAKKGEKMTTLDGQERKLDSGMLLITDSDGPVAIAGVMGGGNSEINENTTSIIIESANFDPVSIRQTSQKLGLRTEASQRFEKSLDPNLCEIALQRITELIKESCPKAKIASKIADEKKFKLNQKPIKINIEWLIKKIGVEINKSEAERILKNLGFKFSSSAKLITVKVPSWRATKDINIPEDIAEEVARIYGYNNIKASMPAAEMQAPEINQEREFINKIKDILSLETGMNEVYNYSFVNEKQVANLGFDAGDYIKLANPLTNEHTLLRKNLFPNLLENVVINQRNVEDIKIYEIGKVFINTNGDDSKKKGGWEKLPKQPLRLGLLCAGEKTDAFSKLKGIIDFLGLKLRIELNYENDDNDAIIKLNNKPIGIIRIIDINTAKKVGVKIKTAVAELDVSELIKTYEQAGAVQYAPKNKFPYVEQDLAFVVSEKILYNDIRKEILSVDKLIKEMELFDVYVGDKVEAGKKSLAFHISFGDENKTLTGEEVDRVRDEIIKHLEKKFGAKLRDF